jgi:hypothetical protein
MCLRGGADAGLKVFMPPSFAAQKTGPLARIASRSLLIPIVPLPLSVLSWPSSVRVQSRRRGTVLVVPATHKFIYVLITALLEHRSTKKRTWVAVSVS